MSGTGVPIKESPERPPLSFLTSVHSEKTAGSEPVSRSSTTHEICQGLDFDVPDSRTVRGFFIRTLSVEFCSSSQKD